MRPYREAIVLAGGFGTRLAHVVPDVCKPMASVAGRPFLRFIMDQLAASGFDRAAVADGYRREQIEDFFGFAYRGIAVEYSPEDTPLFTGGAVKKALRRCQSDWVFVLNGDTWLDTDFAAMEVAAADAHEDVSAIIAVKRMHGFERYGTVDVDSGGALTAFHEKRPCEEGFINAGVYLLRGDALDGMPEKFSLESDYFERVVGDGPLRAVECEGGFIDIGFSGTTSSPRRCLRLLPNPGSSPCSTATARSTLTPGTCTSRRSWSCSPPRSTSCAATPRTPTTRSWWPTRPASPRAFTPRPTCASYTVT